MLNDPYCIDTNTYYLPRTIIIEQHVLLKFALTWPNAQLKNVPHTHLADYYNYSRLHLLHTILTYL